MQVQHHFAIARFQVLLCQVLQGFQNSVFEAFFAALCISALQEGCKTRAEERQMDKCQWHMVLTGRADTKMT